MQKTEKLLVFGGIGLAAFVVVVSGSWQTILKTFLYDWEGFSATPYWDVSRYSWGYGTPAPGATGTITRAAAMQELLQHARSDRAYLGPLITVALSPRQWAAVLSFSYNLGPGDGDNLVRNINSQDWDALEKQWLAYDLVNGNYSAHQEERRQAEWKLFSE